MGMENMSAIIKTVTVRHFLSLVAKKRYRKSFDGEKSKTNQITALSETYHAYVHKNNKHLYLWYY